MLCPIDTDALIEGVRADPEFISWLESVSEVASEDVVRGEFLLGVHAVPDPAKRRRGEEFYVERINGLASLASDPSD